MDELKTRTQWLSEPSPLDSIFKNVSTEEFVEALKNIPDIVFESDDSVALARKLAKGEPDEIIVPRPLAQEVSKFIRIIHGWHNSDYVWHVEPASIRRPWRVEEDDVVYRVARIMHDNLPDIEGKFWFPEMNWELRTITFKAFGLKEHWGFQESRIPIINARLFENLNMVV
jgi:hypothetical protein